MTKATDELRRATRAFLAAASQQQVVDVPHGVIEAARLFEVLCGRNTGGR